MAIGYGAPEPAPVALGLEEFDEDDPKENQSKTNFYSYYFVARNLECLVSGTILIYIGSRGIGHRTSIKKMSLEALRNGEGLYDTGEGDDSRKILHVDDFR